MSATAAEDLRKGWCPGALRPMAARDGLLVRLRITGGIVPAATAHAIADLAERHGNGLLDLSARANLQLRGVCEAALPALWEGLSTLDLLDADAGGEAVRNVLCSPLAGLILPRDSGGGGPREAWWRGRPSPGSSTRNATNELLDREARLPPPPPSAVPLPRFAEEDRRPDIRPLASALEAALVADPALRALPAKFGILLDDGGAPSLAGVPSDLRYDWDGAFFAAALGGTAADALDLGRVAMDDVVAHALGVAHRLLALPDAARPRRLFREMGRDAVAAWFGAQPARARSRATPPDVVGGHTFHGVATFGLAAPFGRFDATMLRAAADASAGELRLTPWRTILLPGVAEAAAPGFVADPADPRLRVVACTGETGCERGTTDTHADAFHLAALAGALPGEGIALHVSGCAKGCAHPARAPLTLVGRDGRYDLVRDGRPGDAADAKGLAIDDIEMVFDRTDGMENGVMIPPLPSPLWGGAGVGVPPYASDTRRSPSQPTRPTIPPGPTPTPNPSPQGGGEFARGSER